MSPLTKLVFQKQCGFNYSFINKVLKTHGIPIKNDLNLKIENKKENRLKIIF